MYELHFLWSILPLLLGTLVGPGGALGKGASRPGQAL